MSSCSSVALVALVALAAVSCASGGSTPVTGRDAPVDGKGVLAVSDAVLAAAFELTPERVALLRPPGMRYDDLPEETPSAYARRAADEDRWLAELAAVRADALPPRAALAADITRELLEAARATRVCRQETWDVSQMNGWQVRFGNLAAAQPVGTPDLRAQTLARWRKMPGWIDAHIALVRRGLGEGRVATAIAVTATLDQVDALLASPPSTSPFVSPAERDPDPQFRAALEGIVGGELRAATTRYRAFLADEVLPRARRSPGLGGFPDGPACYRALLRASTTLPALTPEEVHAKGKAALEELLREMTELSARHFGGVRPKELFERFRTEPRFLYRDEAEVIAQAEGAYERAKAALPRAFGVLPRAPMRIEPIPAFQEKKMAAHYLVPAVDGSRPGTYRIRTYEAERQSRVDGESTAFHEGLPGHHLQLAIAAERADNPAIARLSWSSAFGEGWALYAERLAGELDLFTSPEARFGMLSALAFRAVRLVVDTGIHAFGWDRPRAVAELLANTPITQTHAESEVDRYIAWPGQATSYMTGYLTIRELRRRAEAKLGARFDLRAFHDELLSSGCAPLPVIERRMNAWIASR